MCTGDFCWQSDVDEVVHENDVEKIILLCKHKFPTNVDIVSLPVIEYWGCKEKIRIDVTPWKWRLSKNKSYITHGIPKELRTYDSDGNLMAVGGSDGCDLIHKDTFERLHHATFYTQDIDRMRLIALHGASIQALIQYENWFNLCIQTLPSVYHFSWYNLERKIKLYRDYWQKHWNDLVGKNTNDTSENNMFFNLPWKEITDEMISNKAEELKNKCGGWVFHTKWNGTFTPSIKINNEMPKFAKEFYLKG